MVQGFGGQAGRWQWPWVALLALVSAAPAGAVRVTDLYAESVPLADATAGAQQLAFAEALRRVLIKVSGQGALAGDAGVLQRFGDPAVMVQQFRRDSAGTLWAQFDPVAVRRGLEAAGLPVWGEERPLTVAWIAWDDGTGARDVLAAATPEAGPGAALREELLRTARTRGIPLALPLRDSQDLAAVSWADIWGEFTAPLVTASARYGADAVLVGRVRTFPPGMNDARWTLLLGEERLEWRGSVADGPDGLAERLAQRLAVGGPAAGGSTVRLAVSGIGSMEQYGTVLAGLQGLDAVASLAVVELVGDSVVFQLGLRTDHARLVRALAVARLLEPAADAAAAPPGAAPVMHYRLAGLP